ncbi:DUF6377 domain-containing protein [Flammeovirgaceae bacterium SG7u.111]|nr:DUF6377 domain-containing protein [Flammeovirgaceae bacterium SG7u.132]WPO37782.1 DUF6377 domain-containing protein [Flammeovirgaceae bacterium SG7u.111]
MNLLKSTTILLLLSLPAVASANREIDSLIQELDKQIALREESKLEKEQKINHLKSLLENDSTTDKQKYLLLNELYHQYEAYQFDGALHFAYASLELAQTINDQNLIYESKLNLAAVLVTSGIYHEPNEIIKSIDPSKLGHDLLVKYYSVYKNLYNQLYFYSPTRSVKEQYVNLYHAYCDSLLAILPESSEQYLDIIETRALDSRNLEEAKKINTLRLSRTSIGLREFSKVAFLRSLIFQVEGDSKQQKKYLILSAISDIKGVTKDNASLTTLAFKLYEDGEIDRAYQYINISVEDAMFYNSKLRSSQIANVLPLISTSYEAKLSEKNNSLERFIIAISVLSIILLIAIIFIWRQIRSVRLAKNISIRANNNLKTINNDLTEANKKLSQLHGDLSDTNHVKEVYIGEFLKICSDYIGKLENQSNHVKKMLVNRKYGELLNELKEEDIRKKEMKEFFKNFDLTFLNIYPHFIEEINKLIDPNDPVSIKNSGFLSTELRVFALIRLGISDSSKIAKVLGTSVTTIYNYRVKMKNRAVVEREKFEEHLLNIG